MTQKQIDAKFARVNYYLEKITREIYQKIREKEARKERKKERERIAQEKRWKKLGINFSGFRAQQACNREKRRLAFCNPK